MRVAVREHNSIMRRNLRFFNGYEVKTEGDAFMVSFKNVLDAISWAVTSQMQLLEADWPQEILESPDGKEIYGPKSLDNPDGKESLLYRGLSIRMGMHCGTPVCELDPTTRRMDYFGPMVNKSARVCGNAEGGQILVSKDVERAYRKLKMAGAKEEASPSGAASKGSRSSTAEKLMVLEQLDLQFIDAGERKLKGFEKSEMLVSMLPRDLIGRHQVPPPPLEKAEPEKSPIPVAEMPEEVSRPEILIGTESMNGSENPTSGASTPASGTNTEPGSPSHRRLSISNRRPQRDRMSQLAEPITESELEGERTDWELIENVEGSMAYLNARLERLVLRSISGVVQELEGTSSEANSLPALDQDEAMFNAEDLSTLKDTVLEVALRQQESTRNSFSQFLERLENAISSLDMATHSEALKQAVDASGAHRDNLIKMMKMLLSLASRNMNEQNEIV